MGINEINFTMVIQLLNMVLWIGGVYIIFRLIISLPKRLKESEERIEKMEKVLDELNKKLN